MLLAAGSLAGIECAARAGRLGIVHMLPLGAFEVTLGAWPLVRGVRPPPPEPA